MALSCRNIPLARAFTTLPARVSSAFHPTLLESRRSSLLLYSTTTPVTQGVSVKDRIRTAYEERETDGILDLGKDLDFSKDFPPARLLEMTLETARSNKGVAASILNGWLGSCFLQQKPSYALELWRTVEESSEENGLHSDLVTLCLVFSCLHQHADFRDIAIAEVLDLAIRRSKKQAGSKRRKAMAAARRKATPSSAFEVEDQLQGMLGPDFGVLFENDDVYVFDKPSGVSCFHKHATTAGKIKGKGKKKKGNEKYQADISLEDALLHVNLPLSTINSEARGLAHRIDRGTSGCIVMAKHDAAHALLLTEFFLRRVQKNYACLTFPVPTKSEAEINLPVHGRPALSYARVEEVIGNAALITVETKTGRKHQVRAHCATGLGCPIIGDDMYSDGQEVSEIVTDLLKTNPSPKDGFFLHAASMSIPSFSITGIKAPLPTWWSPVMEGLRNHKS